MVILALAAALVAGGRAAAEAPAACAPLVAGARWADASLSVRPSRCGRRAAIEAPGRVFAQALAVAGPGPVARRSQIDQLRCHAYFAPFKPRWNLEAWRPAVAWPALIATACNPPSA